MGSIEVQPDPIYMHTQEYDVKARVFGQAVDDAIVASCSDTH